MVAGEKNFCRNLKHIRKQKKMTQKEMARILKIGVSTLRKIENEDPTVRISGQMLYRVCAALDVPSDRLLSEAPEENI